MSCRSFIFPVSARIWRFVGLLWRGAFILGALTVLRSEEVNQTKQYTDYRGVQMPGDSFSGVLASDSFGFPIKKKDIVKVVINSAHFDDNGSVAGINPDSGDSCGHLADIHNHEIPVGNIRIVDDHLEVDAAAQDDPKCGARVGYDINITWTVNDCPTCRSSCPAGSYQAGFNNAGNGGGTGIDLTVSLGSGSEGKTAGTLSLSAVTPSAALATPAALQTSLVKDGTERVIVNGVVRQVVTPQGLTDIVTIDAYKYEMRFYTTDQIGPKDANGIYQPTGSPYKVITIENPDHSATVYNRLRITDSSGKVDEYIWDPSTNSWTLNNGNGLQLTSVAKSIDPATGDRIEITTVKNPGGAVISKTLRQFHTFSWGEEMVRQVEDPDGAALTTTWDYYDKPTPNRESAAAGLSIVDHGGADLRISSYTTLSGRHVNIGAFRVDPGALVTVPNKLWIEARTVDVQGNISAVGAGLPGATPGGDGGRRGFFYRFSPNGPTGGITWSQFEDDGQPGQAASGTTGGTAGAPGPAGVTPTDGAPFPNYRTPTGWPILPYPNIKDGFAGGTGGSGGYNNSGHNTDNTTDFSLQPGGGGGSAGGGGGAETIDRTGTNDLDHYFITIDNTTVPGGAGGKGGNGGDGGGDIYLIAQESVQVGGTLLAQGTSGTSGTPGDAVHSSPPLDGVGTVVGQGGNGGTGGSGCGGGILLSGKSINITGTASASGGPGGTIKMIGSSISHGSGTLQYGRIYEANSDGVNYGHLKQVIYPTGAWERYDYDVSGQLSKTVRQFMDNPISSADTQNRATYTTYQAADPQETTVEQILGQEIGRRYVVRSSGSEMDIVATTAGASWTDPGDMVTITKTMVGGAFDGRTQSVKNPDGTMTIYAYDRSNNQTTTTTSTGKPDSSGTSIVDGTKTVAVQDSTGNQIYQATYDILSGLLLSSSSTTQQDSFGRPTRIDYLDGTHTTTIYGCCGVDSETDREGLTTTYIYDDLKRVLSSTRAGITTIYAYDAAGRTVSTTRKGSDNSEIVLNRSAYDMLGRLVASTNALNNATSYSQAANPSGHQIKTTTNPDGSTRIEEYAMEGSLLSVSGTSVHPLRYEYGIDNDGSFTKEIRVGDGGTETEWTKAYTDLAGRTYKTVTSAGAVTLSSYNNLGQLVKQVDPDGVTMLYAYNGKGEQEYGAIDMDRNGSIDFGGVDRITRTQNRVLTAHNVTVQRQTSTVWTGSGFSSTKTVSTQDASVDRLQTWSTVYGVTTQSQTIYDGAGGHTMISTAPDGTKTTTTYQNGNLISSVTQNAGTGTLDSSTCTYDAHGRMVSVTDAQGLVTTTTYNNADQTLSVSLHAADGLTQTTSYTYDVVGRRTNTTASDGGVVANHYFPTGELKDISGARTYPVQYTYDNQGRLKTMYAGTGLTTWNYDASSGLLQAKLYADGKGPSYTYTPAGRLKSRLWARNVATGYDYNNAGELAYTSYSDNTPAVRIVYDRLGRRKQISMEGSQPYTTKYAYNDAGQVLSESYAGGPLNGVTVANSYDSLLRRNTLTASLNSQPLSYASYDYDSASRLKTVSDSSSHSATYAYVPNSSMVSGIAFKTGSSTVMTTTKSYDGLKRLTNIASVNPQNVPYNSFTYTYNNADQRTRVDQVDGSYWMYTYDALGQATSGRKYWHDNTPVAGQQFEYNFDNIGNRTSTKNGGDATGNGLKEAHYSANSLNQYMQRTVPGGVDVMGSAPTNAVVTVNQQPAYRKDDYFWRELSVTNQSSAVLLDVSAIGVTGNSSTNLVGSTGGKLFIPKTPEIFIYDTDGNLVQDGRWIYVWDAENRLVSMQDVVSSASKKKLEFVYDSLGRRIQKNVYNWNGSLYVIVSTQKCVYDNWNKTAELDGSNQLTQSFLWGLDLSGAIQGVGGIGGLLAMKDVGSNSDHFYCFDGNGNVISLLNADTKQISAKYQYGPFGESVEATGAIAKLNPFGFSTKYVDEAGIDYGLRILAVSTGRWLNRDVIEEIDSANVYSFVHNNTINMVDVLGMWGTDQHHSLIDTWLGENPASNSQSWDSFKWHCIKLNIPALLKKGNDIVDGVGLGGAAFCDAQSSANSYQHAMRAWNQSPSSAEALYNIFIQQQIYEAKREHQTALALVDDYPDTAKSCMERAITAIGMAQHPVADSTSPPHAGFQAWYGPVDGAVILGPLAYALFVEAHHLRESPGVYASKGDAPARTVASQMHSKLLDILRE